MRILCGSFEGYENDDDVLQRKQVVLYYQDDEDERFYFYDALDVWSSDLDLTTVEGKLVRPEFFPAASPAWGPPVSERPTLEDGEVYVKRPEVADMPWEDDLRTTTVNGKETGRTGYHFNDEVRAHEEFLKTRPQHTNIVQYLGWMEGKHEYSGRVVAVFLRNHGWNLKRVIRLEPERVEVEKILKGVRSALTHIHSTGLVYLDLAPMNILIDPDGEPILIDFDSSKPAGVKIPDPPIGIKMGHKDFAAPMRQVPKKKHDWVSFDKFEKWLREQAKEAEEQGKPFGRPKADKGVAEVTEAFSAL